MSSKEVKEQESNIERNVVVLPDEETSAKMVEWSRRIAEQFPTPVRLGKNSLPHLSLYPAAYPGRNRQGIERTVQGLASSQRDFQVRLGGYSAFSGFLFLMRLKIEIHN